ncbi:hypothetical protein [Streptomyces canus]|uniref:hypothetical protein n=1 Tax=Streptomyces canus TaxID=58343 RepID=UPI0033AA881C
MVVLLGTTLHCLAKGELPTSAQRWFRPTAKYWVVNVAQESTSMEVELDSADKGLRFHGTIDVDWRIADAKQAVERNHFDVERQLRRLLLPRLSAAAKDCAYDAVTELEERLTREQFTGETGDGLLEVVDISFDLRPDPGATEILRAGALDEMRRSQATDVLARGEQAITAEAVARNPELVVELVRNMRDDKRAVLHAQLEIARVMHALEGGDEHRQMHAAHELLAQLGRYVPGASGELPPPRVAEGPFQLDDADQSADPDKGSRNRSLNVEE